MATIGESRVRIARKVSSAATVVLAHHWCTRGAGGRAGRITGTRAYGIDGGSIALAGGLKGQKKLPIHSLPGHRLSCPQERVMIAKRTPFASIWAVSRDRDRVGTMTEDHPPSPVRTSFSASRSGPRLRIGVSGKISFWAMQLVYLALGAAFLYLGVMVFLTRPH